MLDGHLGSGTLAFGGLSNISMVSSFSACKVETEEVATEEEAKAMREVLQGRVPPGLDAETQEGALPADKYYGWIDLTSHQLLHLHVWHIPR